MPTDQPNSAPDALPQDARDDATAATVLHDADMDDMPGGGGLGGAAAADSASDSGAAPSGASRNSPIDVPVPEGLTDPAGAAPSAEREARQQAAAADPVEPHPSSS